MNLDEFIITCFCWIDETVPVITQEQRLRQRGPMPQLADSEVLTMEVVGSYLGLSQDSELFAYFQAHYRHFFPAMSTIHRSTFVRQAANRLFRANGAARLLTQQKREIAIAL